MKLYALQFTELSKDHHLSKYTINKLGQLVGKMVGFTTRDNRDSDFCVAVSYTLSEYSDHIWVTTNRSIAERVAVTNTEWYNADFDSPANPFVGALRVVELSVVG